MHLCVFSVGSLERKRVDGILEVLDIVAGDAEIIADFNAFIGAHRQVRFPASAEEIVEVFAQNDLTASLAARRRKTVKAKRVAVRDLLPLCKSNHLVSDHDRLATKIE